MISPKKVTMAEWECSAVVTVWFRVQILLISLDWFEFLQFRVARASCLFASSEVYMCDCHWPAKSPMSAFLSLLRLRLFSNILTSSCHLVICGCRLSLGGLDGLPCIMKCPMHNEILSITLHECSLFTIYHTVFIILHPSRDLRLPSASRLNSSIDCLE